jgi:hypothetical protein
MTNEYLEHISEATLLDGGRRGGEIIVPESQTSADSPETCIQTPCRVNALGPVGDRGTNGRVPGTNDSIRPTQRRIASKIKGDRTDRGPQLGVENDG